MKSLFILVLAFTVGAYAQVKAPESVVVDGPKKKAEKKEEVNEKDSIDTPYYFSINLLWGKNPYSKPRKAIGLSAGFLAKASKKFNPQSESSFIGKVAAGDKREYLIKKMNIKLVHSVEKHVGKKSFEVNISFVNLDEDEKTLKIFRFTGVNEGDTLIIPFRNFVFLETLMKK